MGHIHVKFILRKVFDAIPKNQETIWMVPKYTDNIIILKRHVPKFLEPTMTHLTEGSKTEKIGNYITPPYKETGYLKKRWIINILQKLLYSMSTE